MLERLPLIRQKSGHLLDGLNTGNSKFLRCLEVNMLWLYEPVSPTMTGSAWYAVWTLTSGSRGNVSKLHICESDALVVLFGHWLTSIESDPLTVSLWAVNLPSGCKLMPAFLYSNGYALVKPAPDLVINQKKSPITGDDLASLNQSWNDTLPEKKAKKKKKIKNKTLSKGSGHH